MKNVVRLICVSLFAAFLLVNCGGASGPKDVAKESFKMIEANDVSGVKDLMSSQIKGMITDDKLEDGVAKRSEEMKKKGGISDIEFLSEDIQEETAEFKVKITYGDGTSTTEKTTLVKEDGDWKIGASK